VAELRTEEEQIAVLKEWWKKNGNSILISVAVALAIIFGWNAYQNAVIENKSEASAMYEQVIAAAATSAAVAGESTGLGYLAQQLKDKHGDTEYGLYAALFIARDAIENAQFDQAKQELEWVKSNTEDGRLLDIVNGRLARVLSQQGEHDQALALLNANSSEYESIFLEIKGDIQLRKGEKAAAIENYERAHAMVSDNPQKQPLLVAKLANLGVETE